MVKITVCVLIILFAILGLGIFEVFYVKNNVFLLEEKIEFLYEKNKEKSIATQDFDEIEVWWENKKKMLNIFIDHSFISGVGESLVMAKSLVENNKYDFADGYIQQARKYIDSMYTNFAFTLQNIL